MVEKAFPRGRGGGEAKDEKQVKKHKLLLDKKRKDVLFGAKSSLRGESPSPHPKKIKTTAASTTAESNQAEEASGSRSMLPIGGGGCSRSKSGIHIESLSFTKFHPGFKVLAVCRQADEEVAIFSLPNLWTAYMMRTAGQPPLNVSLQRNQVMAVVIVKAVQESTKEGPRRRIQVTCLPEHINPTEYNVKGLILRGIVKSVEDHGVLVDLGMARTGFLAFDAIKAEDYTSDRVDDEGTTEDDTKVHLHEGRILDLVVRDTSKTKVLPLCLPKHMEMVTLPAGHKPQIQDLQPGTLVKAVTLEATMSNGLAVMFGGSTFRGAIELAHLGALWVPASGQADGTKWKQFFQAHPSFMARILAVDPKSKIIRLTMLPHLLRLKAPECATLPKVGDVIEDCTVLRLDKGVGALLAYPDAVDEDPPVKPIDENNSEYMEATRVRAVYVHISKASDPEKDKDSRFTQEAFAKTFALSSKHTVRVIQTNHLVDGVASGATAPNIVDAHVMTLADIVPGHVYRQVPVAVKLSGGSVIVDFGNGVRGLIASDQMFDEVSRGSTIREKVREAKFAVGSKVDVRVLSVDSHTQRVVVTAKKSLVKADEEEILTTYEDIKEGQIAVGFISRVDKGGLFVSFFNKVYGRVTARSLTAELGVESPTDNYKRGEVVRCRVVFVKERSRKPFNEKLDGADDMDVDEDVPAAERHYDLRLSLLLETNAVPGPEKENVVSAIKNTISLQVNTILPAKSMRVVELWPCRKKEFVFVPGFAIVSIKARHILSADDLAGAPETIECKLPYDQLLDEVDDECRENLELLDGVAHKLLTKGKKINRKGLVLVDPKKQLKDYTKAFGDLATVTIKPRLVSAIEDQPDTPQDGDVILPGPGSRLFSGALVIGHVMNIDTRHGAFVQFIGGWSGLYPKSKGGLMLKRFNTIEAKVLVFDDSKSPPKIILGPPTYEHSTDDPITVGETIPIAKVLDVDFNWLSVGWTHDAEEVEGRVHCSMFKPLTEPKLPPGGCHNRVISSCHPFWGLSKGDEMPNLKVVQLRSKRSVPFQLASDSFEPIPRDDSLVVGDKVSGIIADFKKDSGLVVRVTSSCVGVVPLLELSDKPNVLCSPTEHFPIGSRLHCVVSRVPKGEKQSSDRSEGLQFSVLRLLEETIERTHPSPGDLIVGVVDRGIRQVLRPPELLLRLRNGRTGRCCITELEEMDEWTNFPLGRPIVDENGDATSDHQSKFKDGDFVLCRVLQRIRGSPVVEVSLRPSRIEGDIDNDEKPVPGNLVSGYVIETNKKGCFVRLSREAEARSTLKELCDGFIADPAASFPRGRLIAAKVKDVRSIKSDKTGIRYQVDIDMRESKLGDGDTMTFEQVETGSKYDGVITRTERYGVFVSLDSSDVSVFVHLTECCEQRMSNPANHFAPGDRVKVMITAKDVDKRRISGSMKARHFEDNDSDDDSDLLDEVDEMDIDADKGGVEEVDNPEKVDDDDDEDDSHDDGDSASDDGSSGQSSGDDNTDSSADAASAEEEALDTNVGFDWAGTTVLSKKEEAREESGSESSDDDEEDGDGNEKKKSKRSRKKHSERRKHEQSIASREAALADGTADENPETAADYERLLASQPNSSELWIRFMALHLGLADVSSARKVAERALDRIEFRLETEKLNVWCALLMLEMKYGDEASLKAARENACKHNNPKHIHLRMCEMYEKASCESPSVESTAKADEMFELTCKRFKDKKKVWMAQLEYLLKSRRQEEAFEVSKRALKSLKPYKHTETMSKFAQLMFQYGSAEKARTIFEGLLRQNAKRLDIFFVYADKEIKHGDADAARALFSKVANRQDTSIPLKLTDKQMKSFFKKWFHFEEAHGTDQTCEAVKAAARKYVQG